MSSGHPLPLRTIGDPVLRAPVRALAPGDISGADIQELIEAMVATMRAAPGVGLAAPQVGHSLGVLVIEDPESLQERLAPEQRRERGRDIPFPLTVMINPEVRLLDEGRTVFAEGCLSIPGYVALVERAFAVEARWTGRDGTRRPWTRLSGWPARILQHEFDHLTGILYTDRMKPGSFVATEHVDRLSDLVLQGDPA